MAWIADAVYRLALALWVGGVSIFTFLVTPALFRGLGRDEAARTVGLLFPAYFPYVLSVTLVALAAFLARPRLGWDARRVLCAVLLALAVAASGWSRFWYYPEAAELTREIASFEAVAPEHPLPAPLRAAPRREHGHQPRGPRRRRRAPAPGPEASGVSGAARRPYPRNFSTTRPISSSPRITGSPAALAWR